MDFQSYLGSYLTPIQPNIHCPMSIFQSYLGSYLTIYCLPYCYRSYCLSILFRFLFNYAFVRVHVELNILSILFRFLFNMLMPHDIDRYNRNFQSYLGSYLTLRRFYGYAHYLVFQSYLGSYLTMILYLHCFFVIELSILFRFLFNCIICII